MRISRMLSVGVLATFSVASVFSSAFADSKVVGTRVSFTQLPAYSGETTTMSVSFTVTGGSVNLSAVVEQTIPQRIGPPPPTLVLGTFSPGEYSVEVYRYTVPTSPPARICFNIKMTGGEFKNVCLKQGRESRGWFLDVDSAGQWVEVPTVPAPVPSMEKPDLRITGRLDVDEVLRIENIGRGTAYNVGAVRECFVDGRWIPSSPEFGEKSVLGPGTSFPVRIGKLGRFLGPFPAGTTRVRVVVDPRKEIDELNEDNNIVEASTLPDLRIVDFFAYEYQDELRVRFKITNTGVGDAGRFAWDISLFMDGEWRSFKGERVSALRSGAQIDKYFAIGMILSGTYYIPDNRGYGTREARLRFRVDGLNEVLESNEDDNAKETVIRR